MVHIDLNGTFRLAVPIFEACSEVGLIIFCRSLITCNGRCDLSVIRVIVAFVGTGIAGVRIDHTVDHDHGDQVILDFFLLCGAGEKIARFFGNSDVKVLNFGLKKEFLDRYNPADVLKENRLTPEQIAEDAVALI